MNIPQSVLRAVQNKVPKSQKLLAFMMFMPSVTTGQPHADHTALGTQIRRLIDDGKIRLGTFDENFKLTIIQL